MTRPDWWPDADDWLQAAERLHLKRESSELVGPCPACGGTDRFHVHWRGARRGVFACRHGCEWRPILEAAGFGRTAPGPAELRDRDRPAPARSRPPEPKPDPDEARRVAVATDLWERTEDDPGPIGLYLAARGVWPPGQPLPDSVRWLPRDVVAALWWDPPLPASAAGTMACRYEAGGAFRAVDLIALARDGTACRWRKARGAPAGAAFRVPGPADGPIHLAEGPADALALAIWRGVEAWAAGGTSGLRSPDLAGELAATGREIVIEPDGDSAGRSAAIAMLMHLRARKCRTRIAAWPEPGTDPAETLSERWRERVALMEIDGNMTARAARIAAWSAMLPKPGTGSGTRAGQAVKERTERT